MDRSILMGFVLAFLALLLIFMYLGWRARQKRQSYLPKPLDVPQDAGAELLSLKAFYVSSTVTGKPMERIAVGGLGYRARASVIVKELGVVLRIPGQRDLFLPREDLVKVDKATWTIDRVVEEGGLVVVSWRLPQSELGLETFETNEIDTYFRVNEAADANRMISAVQSLLTSSSTKGELA